MWLICEHMVKRIWKKGGKWFLFLPLILGLLHILWCAYAGLRSGNGAIQTAKGFLPYEYMVDFSFASFLFTVGLLGLVFVIFLHYRQYHTKSNGMITFLTLPISTKQVVAGLILSGVIWIFLYYAVWFLALVVWYFPATELAAHVAMKQEFLADGNQIITGIDPHIHNGLYLAFFRSTFLSSTFFLTSLEMSWQGLLYQMIWLLCMATAAVMTGMIPRKVWLLPIVLVVLFFAKGYVLSNNIWFLYGDLSGVQLERKYVVTVLFFSVIFLIATEEMIRNMLKKMQRPTA